MGMKPLSDVLVEVEALLMERRRAGQVADAGPDLLVALRGMLLWAGVSGTHRYSADHPVTRARAAIARAEGG